MAFEVFTLKERPDLRPGIFAAAFRPPFFPEFMVHDPAAQLYFSMPFFDAYLEFAFAATDGGEISCPCLQRTLRIRHRGKARAS